MRVAWKNIFFSRSGPGCFRAEEVMQLTFSAMLGKPLWSVFFFFFPWVASTDVRLHLPCHLLMPTEERQVLIISSWNVAAGEEMALWSASPAVFLLLPRRSLLPGEDVAR